MKANGGFLDPTILHGDFNDAKEMIVPLPGEQKWTTTYKADMENLANAVLSGLRSGKMYDFEELGCDPPTPLHKLEFEETETEIVRKPELFTGPIRRARRL